MSYPKKIVQVRPTGGIVNDIPAFEVAPNFYTGGRNVHFRSGFAERTSGHTQVYTTAATQFRSLLNVPVGTTNYWFYAGQSNTYVITGSTESNITIVGGLTAVTAYNTYSVGLLNGLLFFNNAVDAPMYWDGVPTNPMLALPGWPASTSCKALRAFKFHLFALDIDKPAGLFPDQVLWSNAAAPGAIPTTWTAAATNDAGDAILADAPGRIIDGRALGGGFAIYKQAASYIAEYVEGNNVFEFRRLPNNVGPLNLNCIADYKGRHVIFGDGDIVVTDGGPPESIADNRMRRFIFNQLDQDNYTAAFVQAYPAQNEIWFFFPSAGNNRPDLAAVWDTQANAWGVRDVPGVSTAAIGVIDDTSPAQDWNSDSGAWDDDDTQWNQVDFSESEQSFVIADAISPGQGLYQGDVGTDFAGSDINARVTRESMAFEEPNRVKGMRRIIPHIQADSGTAIKVRVGTQMSCSDGISWGSRQTFTVGTDKWIDNMAQGKYLSFEFTSDGGRPWTMVGFDVEAELRGYY